MLYCLRKTTFFRVFRKNGKQVGYIKNLNTYDDELVNDSGIIFIKVLTKEPKELDLIVDKIVSEFNDCNKEDIKNDAVDFFKNLEKKGFLVSGETADEIEQKDPKFSYKLKVEQQSIAGDALTVESAWTRMTRELGCYTLLNDLQMEITNRCNERCVHCYLPMCERKSNSEIDMDLDLFDEFLNQVDEVGLFSLALTGGELLIHKDFKKMLKKVYEHDYPVTVFSNLVCLDDETIELFKDYHLTQVRVSLYSMDPAVHDGITQVRGSWQKTFNSIKKLVDNDIPVSINCPIFRENRDSFMSVIEWGEQNNVSVKADYNFFATFDGTYSNLSHRLTLEDLEIVIPKLFPYDIDYERRVKNIPGRIPHPEKDKCCGACYCNYCMTASGDIYPCTGWQNYTLGNIRKERIDKIVENEPKACYLRNLKRNQFPKCLNCKDINYCRFCLMMNALESPRDSVLDLNEYFCKVAALKHKLIDAEVSKLQNLNK